MKKIRICHITSAHKSTDVRIFEKECTSLAKEDEFEVYLVAKGKSFKKNNVNVIGIGDEPNRRIERITSFSKKAIDKAIELDADVYHLHDPELLLYVSKIKRNNKKVIFDSHEDVGDSILDKSYIPRYLRIFVSSAYKIYSGRQMKKCDALISVTPHIIEKLKKYNDTIAMITNYPILEEGREIGNHSSDINRVIFAGGIQKQWSHDTIINAIAEIGGLVYELYGSSDSEYLSCLESLPGWARTQYHGVVPFHEVQIALSEAGIAVALLKPSHNTAGMLGTIGNTKLFESMAAGLPVICTNFELWKKIVEEYHCGLCVNPESKEELVVALRYLLSHPKEASIMGQNGLIAVKNRFNWSTQESVLINLYKKILFVHETNRRRC